MTTFKPYNLTTWARPKKICVFVDARWEFAYKFVSKFILRRHSNWGGAYSPIFLYNNIKTDHDVQFEKMFFKYDPDEVLVLGEISESIKALINAHLMPFKVKCYSNLEEKEWHRIFYDSESAQILPENKMLSLFTRQFMQKHKFVRFQYNWNDLKKNNELNLIDMLDINFGCIGNEFYASRHFKEDFCQFEIKDENDLCICFDKLSKLDMEYVFYKQFCYLPGNFINKDDKYKETRDAPFEIIVGNTVVDLAFYWNRNLTVIENPYQVRTFYLHSDFLDRSKILKSLYRLIRKLNGYLWRDNDIWMNPVKVFSFSVDESKISQFEKIFQDDIEIEEIRDQHDIYEMMAAGKNFKLDYKNIEPIELIRSFKSEQKQYLPKGEFVQKFRINSNDEEIVLKSPSDFENSYVTNGQGAWISEIYIEYDSRNIGSTVYTALPLNSHVLHPLFNGRRSRVNSARTPCIHIDFHENRLKINKLALPDLPRMAVLMHGYYHFFEEDDYRSKQNINNEYALSRDSDKGSYLKGVIKLFGDLRTVYRYFSNDKYLSIFQKLTNNINEKNEDELATIENKLKKKISALEDMDQDEKINFLKNFIHKSAKRISRKSLINLTFKQLKEKVDIGDCELLSFLDSMMERQVIYSGFEHKCDHCGQTTWFKVDDYKQLMICPGCNHKSSINSQLDWSYRINSLVNSALSDHGLLPVILTLNLPFDTAIDVESFFYTGPIEICNNKDEVINEIDFVIFASGQLVIGEVKASFDTLTKKEIQATIDIAINIRADQVIFTAMDSPSPKKLKIFQSYMSSNAPKSLRGAFINLSEELSMTFVDWIRILR